MRGREGGRTGGEFAGPPGGGVRVGLCWGFWNYVKEGGKGMMSQYDRKCWEKKGLASTKEATSVG